MSSQSVQGTATLTQSPSFENPSVSEHASAEQEVALDDSGREFDAPSSVQVPLYLQETYWWAYIHPAAVRFFERQWLVNLILWGNFAQLRDVALDEMGATIDGNILQVACVYGDFTERLAQRLKPTARLDVVDVAPVQLENLKAKLDGGAPRIALHHQDSSNLHFADASYDCVVLFFLLHEQPEEVRAHLVVAVGLRREPERVEHLRERHIHSHRGDGAFRRMGKQARRP